MKERFLEKMLEEFKSMDFLEDRFLIRSIWTTYCIFYDLEVDTLEYDQTLMDIYTYYNNSSKFGDYDVFDRFMCQMLV